MNKRRESKTEQKSGQEFSPIRVVLMPIGAITALAVAFCLGYLVSIAIFSITGRPNELIAHVITSFLSMAVFITGGALVKLCLELYERAHPEEERERKLKMTRGMMKDTIDALERIAQGDFTVLIPIDQHDPYSELAESVNKMTRELGSMENVRQEFISNVSHEIQSPLTSIAGFAALLKNDDLTFEQRAHYLSVIEAESKRLSSLSENLLKLSALEAGNEPLNFHDFRLDKQLESTALTFEPQWSAKDIQIEVDLDRLSSYGDESLLSQVWVNLLHNALKFTPEKGSIRIDLYDSGDHINVKISDTGIGIAPEDRIHIFERFYKVDKARDRSFGGNGLGLSLVRKIVELHNGKIEVNSTLGEGTTFIVRLPK